MIEDKLREFIRELADECEEFNALRESCLEDNGDADYYEGLVDSREVIIGRLETILEGEE